MSNSKIVGLIVVILFVTVRNLQNNIITARESSPADLISLISNHAEGPFNDIKV